MADGECSLALDTTGMCRIISKIIPLNTDATVKHLSVVSVCSCQLPISQVYLYEQLIDLRLAS